MHLYNIIIINVDELWLKGKNRPLYFKAVKSHIKRVVSLYGENDSVSLVNEDQRLLLSSDITFSETFISALCKIPGIHSIVPAIKSSLEFADIMPALIPEMEFLLKEWERDQKKTFLTFKVVTSRTNKTYPQNSMEISREIGHLLLEKFSQLKVDVKKPELFVAIRVLKSAIYISTRKILGVGGLPWGMSGHLITLLSGGFDSPVASYLMSKRGCKQSFIFFYAYPYVGEEVLDKIKELSKILGQYQKECKLYVIPFGEIQKKIAESCKVEYRTVLFRKFMIDTANLLADKLGGDALLTGDALGQVSSQTIGNISIMDNISKRPIFRPLIGFNKIEIINISKQIETHDISIIPHDDACSLFAPKHPIIRPDNRYLSHYFKDVMFDDMLRNSIEKALVFSILPDKSLQ